MKERGFTLIEMIVVMGVVGILVSIVSTSLFGAIASTSRGVTAREVINDLRQQQLRAMMGGTDSGGSYVDFSVRFETGRYTLFPGQVFAEGNPDNVVVNLETPLMFSAITLPDSTLTFARGSGEVRSFVPGQNTLSLRHAQTGAQTTININALGVVFTQ